MGSTYPAVWGRQQEAIDGSWTTTWAIELRTMSRMPRRALEAIARDCGDVDEGFRVYLQSLGPCCVEAIITTRRPGTRLEYELLTARLFGAIDAGLGEISQIQGAPRKSFLS